jgi:hypothetical protein
MLYPQFEPGEWAELHGLKISNETCLNCKKEFPVNVPVAEPEMRGFQMVAHGCPEAYRYSKWVLLGKKNEEMEKLMREIL